MGAKYFELFVERGRCNEIENYDAALKDNFVDWVCHHKLGEHCFTRKELIAKGLYFNRTPGELIFVKREDHAHLHLKYKWANCKGRKPWNHGMKGDYDGKNESRSKKFKGKTWSLVDGHRVWKEVS
jgi:hypothetical protein